MVWAWYNCKKASKAPESLKKNIPWRSRLLSLAITQYLTLAFCFPQTTNIRRPLYIYKRLNARYSILMSLSLRIFRNNRLQDRISGLRSCSTESRKQVVKTGSVFTTCFRFSDAGSRNYETLRPNKHFERTLSKPPWYPLLKTFFKV